ncbi:MAG: deoxyribonuclease IV [Acidobacteriota bacterium]|nr:MAG: deoxyribonuclease IV [Acidobacteriota bacterium]
MSVAGGLTNAVDRAIEVDSNVLQIFVKNASRWIGPELTDEAVGEFRASRESAKLKCVTAHASYLINLATPAEELWVKSVDAFVNELERCERLGVEYLVVHPGAHVGSGEEQGIARIAEAIERIHSRTEGYNVRIALETTAGQGTTLGYRFEHFRDLFALVRRPDLLEICGDTCHLFAAGYDLRNGEEFERVLDDFDRCIGMEKLKVFHLNDSKRELGSCVDRHEHIGKGCIGLEGFRCLMNDDRLSSVPKILETPKGDNDEFDQINLDLLRSLVQ